jgi:hypothetical protein
VLKGKEHGAPAADESSSAPETDAADTAEAAPAFDPENLAKLKEGLHKFFWDKDNSALPDLFKLFDLNGDGKLSD